ncbi:MAG: hypothetical protein HY776_07760 [Actinobacteria bacterium]|nr:hypothetical protein [Actinomycetota bacterium]
MKKLISQSKNLKALISIVLIILFFSWILVNQFLKQESSQEQLLAYIITASILIFLSIYLWKVLGMSFELIFLVLLVGIAITLFMQLVVAGIAFEFIESFE